MQKKEVSTERNWTVYVLSQLGLSLFQRPSQGSRQFYTGITANLKRRLIDHNTGKTKSTHGCQWEVVCYIKGFTRDEAAAIEKYLKCGDTVAKRHKFYEFAMDQRDTEAHATKYWEYAENKIRFLKWFKFDEQERMDYGRGAVVIGGATSVHKLDHESEDDA